MNDKQFLELEPNNHVPHTLLLSPDLRVSLAGASVGDGCVWSFGMIPE
jgi:hypothetical protein